jgi:RimJ/RimL family protein N-acetyltransferase
VEPASFTFEPLRAADLPLLEAWLRAPHVVRWFGDPTEWLGEIAVNLDEAWVSYYRVELDGVSVGFAQSYRTDLAPKGPWSAEPAGTLGIDFLLGRPEDLGRGLGTRLVRDLARHLERRVDAGTHVRLIADPHPENAASIRSLAANAFRLDERTGLYVREAKR